MLEGVTIEQLRTLRAVAEAGSFSAAARKLGRVQAAVSQATDRLEAQLGLRLFDRSGRVPRLTEHGEAVVAAAARVGDQVDALDELVADLKRGAETRLTIVVDVLFPTASLVLFANDGDRLEIVADEAAHVIVLSGEPIGEPVVPYGPFVMNTMDEIRRAFLDVESGKFGPVPD